MAATGENEMGLRKVLDMTRFASLFILLLHDYYFCYAVFNHWGFSHVISDRLLVNIGHTGLFKNLFTSKLFALGLLLISLLGATGKKDEKLQVRKIIFYLSIGLVLFFFSALFLALNTAYQFRAFSYIVTTTAGYLLIMSGGSLLSRLMHFQLSKDIFNELNETFPQEERKIENAYSVHLPARYQLKGKIRNSWINIINPFRGLLVSGTPGAGKSWFVIQQVIKQHIEKGFCLFVYDFKYDDLTRLTYNWLQLHKHRYKIQPTFYLINFDDLSKSHRCNPLDPASLQDITDAMEAARTILLGLNREWIRKQGDFFVESPINFVTAVIWFLRQYKEGRYCTLPHVIEMIQADYEQLFPVLNSAPEIQALINPFISAFQHDAMEQLEGQMASAKIVLSRLSSPKLYWVLSGADFTLDINNPKHPKVLCIGNNPEKQQVYGAVISLYVSRMIKVINKKDKLPCSLVFDEFPTIFLNHIDSLIATARSNRVATTIAMQDFSQLRKDYGKEEADVIINITGNIISGQAMGETAKLLSERFGKIMQDRESVSVNRNDTSISRSTQMDFAIPASKIAALSSGEFVGLVSDNPEERMKYKMFHATIVTHSKKLRTEEKNFQELPIVALVNHEQVMDCYHQIRLDTKRILCDAIGILKNGQ